MKRKHAADKHAHYVFKTIADLKHVPPHLIRPVMTDLMIWLLAPSIAARHGVEEGRVVLPDEFEWVNDKRHKLEIVITHRALPEPL